MGRYIDPLIDYGFENKLFKKLDEVAAYASMTREERDLYYGNHLVCCL